MQEDAISKNCCRLAASGHLLRQSANGLSLPKMCSETKRMFKDNSSVNSCSSAWINTPDCDGTATVPDCDWDPCLTLCLLMQQLHVGLSVLTKTRRFARTVARS